MEKSFRLWKRSSEDYRGGSAEVYPSEECSRGPSSTAMPSAVSQRGSVRAEQFESVCTGMGDLKLAQDDTRRSVAGGASRFSARTAVTGTLLMPRFKKGVSQPPRGVAGSSV